MVYKMLVIGLVLLSGCDGPKDREANALQCSEHIKQVGSGYGFCYVRPGECAVFCKNIGQSYKGMRNGGCECWPAGAIITGRVE